MSKSTLKHSLFLEFGESGIKILNRLTRDNVNDVLPAFYHHIHQYRDTGLKLDLSELKTIDSAGAATVFHMKKYSEKQNIDTQIIHASDEIQAKLTLFYPEETIPTDRNEKTGLFERVGGKTYQVIFHYIGKYISMTADIFYWSVADLFAQRQYRKGEVVRQALKIGVGAVPIVTAMAFIIGLVLALQSAAQLRNFGANIYIVDLIVIAMMSEMGPLITAILVAGRSGSAIAAEIATMKVTAELDALKTMGLNPLRFIVVPKMYGSLLTIPFLTVLASVAGIIGGLTTAYFYLNVTPEIFYTRIGNVLYNKDIITGLVKSIVFAALIVLTGSYYGFMVDRGAEGVGRVTTKSVVVAISLVIVADSLMSLLFY
ncbi:MAG: ABC transporter permease [Bacteroidota bacterium]